MRVRWLGWAAAVLWVPAAVVALDRLRHGRSISAAGDDTTCLSGAATWAVAQGVLAGIGVLLVIAGLLVARRRGGGGWVAVPGAALLVWLAWVGAILADPRDELGVYGGCGLG